MSEQPPTTPASPRLLGCLGAILLLPGLCSLIFIPAAFESISAGDRGLFPVWIEGVLIGAVGVALITWAVRRGFRL